MMNFMKTLLQSYCNMLSMKRTHALLVLVSALQLGCFASQTPFEEFGTDGCERPSGLISPFTERVTPTAVRCVREGRDELGVAWQSACDGTSCTLSREGEPLCTCTDLDFASTCANGIATCRHWAYFDYSEQEIIVAP